MDQETADFGEFQSSLSSDIDVIGYDWKEFDGREWNLEDRRAYFIQDLEGRNWKIYFISFGGSGDGNSIFVKGPATVASTGEIEALDQFSISPNPTQGQTQLTFDWNEGAQNLKGQLFDLQGKVVRNYDFNVNAGQNAINLDNLPTTSGIYILKITDGKQSLLSKLVIE